MNPRKEHSRRRRALAHQWRRRQGFRTPLAALLVVLLGAASGTAWADASATPGFAPGTWRGSAGMSGTSSDGPMRTAFNGKVRFTLTVKPNLAVTGSGTWTTTMTTTGPVAGRTKGVAALTFSGSGSDLRYAGTQKVAGTVTDGTLSRPIGFTKPIKGRFVIRRAGSCKVVGTAAMGDGRSFTWTAVKGTGTCL